MSALQGLKKQLRGIRSTQKITKAMRTVATVKYSKLSKLHGDFREYEDLCRQLLEQYSEAFSAPVREADPLAPAALVVMTGNKGMCGSFNAEILKLAEEEIARLDSPIVIPCGKKAAAFFKSRSHPVEEEVVFSDSPGYEESSALLDMLISWRKSGKVSKVYVAYPKYVNMLNQAPAVTELFPEPDVNREDLMLFVPSDGLAAEKISLSIFRSVFYGLVLQTALGAQAATLMTMRSAYDTATELCQDLEGQINRTRQSLVTASVIETSSGRDEQIS